MEQEKRWSDFSPSAQRAIVVGAIAEAVVTTIALRDLLRRPSADVRGPKLLWVLSFFVQPIGAPLYLVAGRRHPQPERGIAGQGLASAGQREAP